MFKAGFLSAQSELEEKFRIPPIVFEQGQNEENRGQLLKWLKKYKPDAILTFAPEMRQLLQELNYRVPEDIGLAALSVLDGNADTGIHQNPEEIGRVAVLVVISLIHDASRGIPDVFRQVLISGRWVDGTSLPDRVAS
ncbi:MAG: substrate-binding domain-containing protein [Chthoniobacteraceae bacterium]